MAHGCKMCLVLVKTVLFIQLCNGESRYCKEAVDSVKIVETCPTSKKEWDNAARKKDCSKIALQQNCSSVENFEYHCVINGYRTETLEVCAPSRLIFGHCVEFNEPGGVIQDQISAPCIETFPKCAAMYLSSTAYKYPDCYQLVSKRVFVHARTVTATKSTLSVSSAFIPFFIGAANGILIYMIYFFCKKKLKPIFCRYIERRTDIKRKTASLLKNHKEVASKTQSEDPDVLQPDSESLCASEVSTGIISTAANSSSSDSYYDAQEDRELVQRSSVKENDDAKEDRELVQTSSVKENEQCISKRSF